jgi:uncharacterized protein
MADDLTYEQEFARGIELFNTKEFFDCHDVWEELWHDERGEARRFLQGMIQAAVGCYHLSNGNTTGAISQYTKSLDKLSEYRADYHGIALGKLRDELTRCLAGALTMREQNASYEVASDYFPIIISAY